MSDPARYPPLTRTELRAIYDACPTPEVRRLLWEIDRLRRLLTYGAWAVAMRFGNPTYEVHGMAHLECWRGLVEIEPCSLERAPAGYQQEVRAKVENELREWLAKLDAGRAETNARSDACGPKPLPPIGD